MRQKSVESSPAGALPAPSVPLVPKQLQCGYPGSRGPCKKKWGSCPYHPAQKKPGDMTSAEDVAAAAAAETAAQKKREAAEKRKAARKAKEEAGEDAEEEAEEEEEEEESDLESYSEAEDPCEVCQEYAQPQHHRFDGSGSSSNLPTK